MWALLFSTSEFMYYFEFLLRRVNLKLIILIINLWRKNSCICKVYNFVNRDESVLVVSFLSIGLKVCLTNDEKFIQANEIQHMTLIMREKMDNFK
jgi:hypothetical protein